MMKLTRFLPNHRYVLVALLLVTLVFAVGCGSRAAPLTEESLKNAVYQGICYQGIFPEAVTLTDGKYEGYLSLDRGSSRPTIVLIEPCAFGDLDGDGVFDAAVLLVENSGGRGIYVYLAAVLNQRGRPENVATTLLGDRAQVEALTIGSGQINVKMLTHSPGDPLCCPSQELEETYTLEGGELVPAGS